MAVVATLVAGLTLGPEIELAAYRMAQEELTNVLKHAEPVEAHVVLTYAPDALEVEVLDSGSIARPPATHVASGGRVSAHLPTDDAEHA